MSNKEQGGFRLIAMVILSSIFPMLINTTVYAGTTFVKSSEIIAQSDQKNNTAEVASGEYTPVASGEYTPVTSGENTTPSTQQDQDNTETADDNTIPEFTEDSSLQQVHLNI